MRPDGSTLNKVCFSDRREKTFYFDFLFSPPSDVSFNYHVSDIISESGTIYIFTTNQNHKSLTVDAELNLSTPTPSINVVSSSVNVEQGDLFIVGVCRSFSFSLSLFLSEEILPKRHNLFDSCVVYH